MRKIEFIHFSDKILSNIMCRQKRRENKKLLEIGTIFMEDVSVSVVKRIQHFRKFLKEFRKESERLKMEQFEKQNGFAATDDRAKRILVDQMVYTYLKRYPKDDDERNEYTYSNSNPMMRIGWRPSI